MLLLEVSEKSLFNEDTGEFLEIDPVALKLEHSLVSLKKWESKWHVPFLDKSFKKNNVEFADYVRCMMIEDKYVEPEVFLTLNDEESLKVIEYIDDPMSATKIDLDLLKKSTKTFSQDAITAETIYYWMIALNIPIEFQHWHLNSLITLIELIHLKNQPPRKMSSLESAQLRHKINLERRKKYNTKG